MAGSKTSKRVAADKSGGAAAGAAATKANGNAATLMRARDGSGFIKCEECKKDVPVVLISMHSCSLDSKIRMHLESQVVEQVQEKKKTATPKRKSPSSEGKEGKRKKKSKNSDGGVKRKRPPTAFFLFMADFRKEYAIAHPDNKGVAEVAKEGGAKWKSLSDEERQQYVDKAAELKAEFNKASDEVVEVEDDENAEKEGDEAEKEEEVEAEENEDDE